MQNPAKEIAGVIRDLTQSPPSKQQETILTYFAPNASLTHPLCRTGSFDRGKWNSRWLISQIYLWYKIMSPRIDLTVDSVAFDAEKSLLYTSISQTFRIFVIPGYKANVNLITVLRLERRPSDLRYVIASQEDFYQTTQLARFAWFGAWWLVWLWQFVATGLCVVGAFLLKPVTVIEERLASKKLNQ